MKEGAAGIRATSEEDRSCAASAGVGVTASAPIASAILLEARAVLSASSCAKELRATRLAVC